MKYICLNGLGHSPKIWNKVIENMENKSEIICPDLFSMVSGSEISYSNLYRSFSEYCMKFSEKINICGLSLGGIIALQYSIEHADKINSAIFIGTQYIMPEKLLKFQNLIFNFMPNSQFADMGITKKDFINLSKSMMNLNFESQLKNINFPVLVVCGEKDIFNKPASIRLNKNISSSKLLIIPKTGHEVNREAPRQLAEAIDSFWKND